MLPECLQLLSWCYSQRVYTCTAATRRGSGVWGLLGKSTKPPHGAPLLSWGCGRCHRCCRHLFYYLLRLLLLLLLQLHHFGCHSGPRSCPATPAHESLLLVSTHLLDVVQCPATRPTSQPAHDPRRPGSIAPTNFSSKHKVKDKIIRNFKIETVEH